MLHQLHNRHWIIDGCNWRRGFSLWMHNRSEWCSHSHHSRRNGNQRARYLLKSIIYQLTSLNVSISNWMKTWAAVHTVAIWISYNTQHPSSWAIAARGPNIDTQYRWQPAVYAYLKKPTEFLYTPNSDLCYHQDNRICFMLRRLQFRRSIVVSVLRLNKASTCWARILICSATHLYNSLWALSRHQANFYSRKF